MNYVLEICDKNGLGKVFLCERQNVGFNRVVYNVNNMFVIKICVNPDKESGIIKEIQYFNHNPNYFNPELIVYDITKEKIPYIYTVEEKINGNNLFDVWGNLDDNSREQCLSELVQMLRILYKPTEKKI